jgi:hypothetical protein
VNYVSLWQYAYANAPGGPSPDADGCVGIARRR